MNLNFAKPYPITQHINVWQTATARESQVELNRHLKYDTSFDRSNITALYVFRVGYLGISLTVASVKSCGLIKEEANFEKNGYVYVEDADSEGTTKKITAELEEGEISCTAHLFKTDGLFGVDVYALVLEFSSDKDMQEALSESETLKGFVKDAQDSDFVNGNCMLVPISLTKAEEMIKIFKGEKLD